MRILLADDDTITLALLNATLCHLGYEVLQARDGLQAWEALRTGAPDLALLDWNMPGWNGPELCRRAQTLDRFIYLILLTANDSSADVIAGLDAGANDYIIKPFDLQELKSRIAVGGRVVAYETRLRQMNDELRRYSSQMESLAQDRAKQLLRADRMVTLGTMAAGIAHEVNNPLAILQGNLKLLSTLWRSELPSPVPAASAGQDGLSPLPKEDLLGVMTNAVQRIRQIVDGMRHFSHGTGGQVVELDLAACLEDALAICLPKTKSRIAVASDLEPLPFPVKGNPVQIAQVLVNLIGNAADALAGTSDPRIEVKARAAEEKVRMEVCDNGPGIAPEAADQLWSPFYTTKPVGEGTGLGLFICRSILEEHHGRIWVESQPGSGTRFCFEIPSAEAFDRLSAAPPAERPHPG
jgi:two-component system, NtrC family, sensor kinase